MCKNNVAFSRGTPLLCVKTLQNASHCFAVNTRDLASSLNEQMVTALDGNVRIILGDRVCVAVDFADESRSINLLSFAMGLRRSAAARMQSDHRSGALTYDTVRVRASGAESSVLVHVTIGNEMARC